MASPPGTSPTPVWPALSVSVTRLRVKSGACAPLRLSSMLSRPATGMTRICRITGALMGSGERLLDFHAGHFLDEGDNCRVIQVPLAFVHQGNEHLLRQAGEGQRNLHGFGRQKGVAQVLLVQRDPKARFEVTGDHHRSLGIDRKSTRLNSSHLGISY